MSTSHEALYSFGHNGEGCTCAGGIGPDGRVYHDNSRCPLHSPHGIVVAVAEEVTCQYCGRVVRTMDGPNGRLVMFGHHSAMPWPKGDPLCQGSGEETQGE